MSTTQSDSIVDVVPPTVIVTPPAEATIAPRITLHSGDVMSRTEFHDRYEHTAKGFKAELIDGVVFVASPVQLKHSRPDNLFHGLLAFYEARTPGVESAANATVLLGPSDEVQPDSLLRVRPNYGGRSKPATEATGDYVVGPPELVVEIANTSRSIDLHKKRDVYRRSGVLEYVVFSADDLALYWFDLPSDAVHTDSVDGVLRMKTFPGLWIDGVAICHSAFAKAFKTLEAGLASPEHAEFVKRLEAQRDRLAAESQPAAE